MTSVRLASDSMSCSFWACSTICDTRSWHSISFTSTSPAISCWSSPCSAAAKWSSHCKKTTTSGRRSHLPNLDIPSCTSSNGATRTIGRTGGYPTAHAWKRCSAAPGLRSPPIRKARSISAAVASARTRRAPSIPHGERTMIEAAMIWNEPNNKSHWDPQIDPGWAKFAEMATLAAQAIRAAHPTILRVLGGISPIDPSFIANLSSRGVLDHIDVVAVHGFPLDWNLWMIDDWPAKLEEIQAVTRLPVWVTEVGVSSFGAEEVQAWGVTRTAELLAGRSARIHWYSLF